MDLFNTKKVAKLEKELGFHTKKLVELSGKIDDMEQVRVGAEISEIVNERMRFSDPTYERLPKKVPIKDAITLLYKHLNLEVTQTKAVASKTILRKIKKEKKK